MVFLIGYPRGIGTDGAFYALSGYNLFHGQGLTYSDVPNTFTWPLFSILIGLLGLICDDLQVCAHIILTLSFAFGVFPLYYAARNLFNDQIAKIALWLYVLNGFLLKISARMTPESLMILMLLISVYYTSKILKSVMQNEKLNKTDFVFSGLFLGLCYLVKPEGFQYFVITFVFLIVLFLYKKKLQHEAVSLGILFFVFIIVVAPQIVFIHDVTGKWELTTYNRFLFRGFVEPLISLSPGQPSSDPKMEYNYNAYVVRGPYTAEQFQNDRAVLDIHFLKYTKSVLTVIGPVSLTLLAFFVFRRVGLYHLSKKYVLFMLLPMLTMIFWYDTKDKFFIVSVPFFIMIGAYFLSEVREKFKNRPYFFYILFLLIYLQSYTPIANQAPANAVIGNHRKLGTWIRDSIPDIEGKLIADRKPYITYFVRGRYFRYNKMHDYQTLVSALKENKVDYLVVDDFYTRTKNPGISELLDRRDRSELKFIHAEEDSSWGQAILYKVEK